MGGSMDPRNYYDRLGEDEWERLDLNPVRRVEFENTTAYLEREIPTGSLVLDAGGGAGRYAVWLAERGNDVRLVDPSAGQVDVAREKIRERGVGERVRLGRGDVRSLPFDADTFDAVCCLGGPISHLLEENDRDRALRELRRVAVVDAPVFVSVMGRLSVVRDLLIRQDIDEGHELLLPELRTGDFDRELAESALGSPAWVRCHFFRADELEAALEAAGIAVETLVGLEGLLSNLPDRLADVEPETEETLKKLANEYREDPAVVEMSEHILAVGRA